MAGMRKTVLAAVIADEASLSAAVDVEGLSPVALVVPAGWTAADITLQCSVDGGATYFNVHESGTDTELTIQAGASRFIGLLDAATKPLAGVDKIKVRSGTSAAAVNQTSGPITVQVICMD